MKRSGMWEQSSKPPHSQISISSI